MKRMLVVSASYAPVLNARAFRWTELAGHFAAAGWEFDIVTMLHPGAPARSEPVKGVRVHRVGFGKVEGVRDRARSGRSGSFVSGVARRIWRALYWPDGDCIWYWPARREALRLVQSRAPDAIVSVSPTFTAVLAGRSAHLASPAARWIIDLGDPFSLETDIAPNNRALYARLNARAERRAFAQAHAVSVTTPQTAKRYAEAFPEAAYKIHVIPPLLSIPPADAQPLFAPGEALRLVYVGTLYRRLREPGFMLQLFEALRGRDRRCELHLFGDVQDFGAELEGWRSRLQGALHVHGTVPRETVARAVAGADILVNIGNTTRDQLPSKVVEYAAAGKPILNLARHADDSSVTFLETYPDRLTLFDAGAAPAASQVDALAAFAERLPRRLPEGEVDAWLAPYRLPRIAAQYERLLQ